VSDGDTFTYLTDAKEQVKVRMHGIDCPEKKQAYGQAAREKLSGLIFGKQVRVQATDTDRYRRVVAIVFVDNVNVNEEMIRSGMAWHYRAYDKNPTWARLQEEARAQRVGLWSQARPTAPWDWRRIQRDKRKAEKEVEVVEEE
jgi:endonuclease YncB( thermonuclease family)